MIVDCSYKLNVIPSTAFDLHHCAASYHAVPESSSGQLHLLWHTLGTSELDQQDAYPVTCSAMLLQSRL